MELVSEGADIAAMQASLKELLIGCGSKAEVQFVIHPTELYLYFRPEGWGADTPTILARGATFQECFLDARTKWHEMRDRVRGDHTRKLALAIIRITYDQSVCSDAALRAEFDAKDIAAYSDEAVTLANSMAERGPFAIVKLSGANAA